MSWPSGTDPFYLANTVDNNARRTYYNVTGTPTMKCDGTTASWPSIQTIITNRMGVASHIWLDLSAQVNGSNLDVTCKAFSDIAIAGNVSLHIVLLDRYSYLPNSPNGQPHHYHAMLKMAPSASGQNFSTTGYDTSTYNATFVLSPSWSVDNLDIACFVQNNSNQEVMQAHLERAPVNFPGLYYAGYRFEDDGNHDGRAEAGETVSMYVTLGNEEPYQTAVDVIGTISTSDPDLTITTPTVNFPDIVNGTTQENVTPFVFSVNSAAQPHATTIHLHVTANPAQVVLDQDIDVYIGWPDVLVVDDDGVGIFETYYALVLNNLGKSFEMWDVNVKGVPPTSSILYYPAVIWFTGFSNLIDAQERSVIQYFLNGGGRLFLNGQNIAQGLNSTAQLFLNTVLHVQYEVANTNDKILNGVAGNPVGDGRTLDCNPGGQGTGSCTNPDGITVLAPAEVAFEYSTAPYSGGLTYEGENGSKLVFFSFPFEAISGQSGSNTREEVLQAIFDFFGPYTPVKDAETAKPVEFLLCETHPNPFNPTTTLQYTLPAASAVELTVYDVGGRVVAQIRQGVQPAGKHEIHFDGSGLASGVYLYRLKTTENYAIGKMVLLK